MGRRKLFGIDHSLRGLSTVGVAALLVACASTQVDPSDTYREVDGNVFNRWVWGGADPTVLTATFAKIEASSGARRIPHQYDTIKKFGPGHWTYEFEVLGDAAFAQAETAENKGDADGALDAFYTASAYYQIAKFPFIRNDNFEHFDRAYKKSLAAYERAGAYFATPLEIVDIPFEGKSVRGYLHLSQATSETPAPIVIISGGIDTFKVEHFPTVKALNESGISALTLDLPGVGESNFMDARYDHDEVYSAALDVLSSDPRIDSESAGVWASSWGGNAAARIAFRDTRFNAVVSACGPVHDALMVPVWAARLFPNRFRAAVPPVILDVTTDRLGLPSPLQNADGAELAKRIRKFSLIQQGLVGGNQTASVPMLVINTNDDPVAPPSDLEALIASADYGELVYTGPGGHCGTRDSMLAISIPWLAKHLIKEE